MKPCAILSAILTLAGAAGGSLDLTAGNVHTPCVDCARFAREYYFYFFAMGP